MVKPFKCRQAGSSTHALNHCAVLSLLKNHSGSYHWFMADLYQTFHLPGDPQGPRANNIIQMLLHSPEIGCHVGNVDLASF